MKCRYCGHEIPEGELICKKCGEEVFIVPDYNPLEDMLTAQIKIGVNDEDADYLDDIAADVRKRTSPRRHTGSSQNMNVRRNTGTGRNMNAGRYTNTGSNSGGRRNTNVRRNTGTGRNMTDRELYERERRRRQAEHKKEMIRKKRQKALLTLTVVIIVILTGCFVLYQNSYSGIVGNGYRALKNQEYGSAENYFRRGIEKTRKKQMHTPGWPRPMSVKISFQTLTSCLPAPLINRKIIRNFMKPILYSVLIPSSR